MMSPLQIYEALLELKDHPELFDEKVDSIWEEFYSGLTPERAQRAKQFRWQIEGQLRGYKDPVARMNKMIELFWRGFQTFQLALTHPDQLIARSQDGSKAVILPIERKPE